MLRPKWVAELDFLRLKFYHPARGLSRTKSQHGLREVATCVAQSRNIHVHIIAEINSNIPKYLKIYSHLYKYTYNNFLYVYWTYEFYWTYEAYFTVYKTEVFFSRNIFPRSNTVKKVFSIKTFLGRKTLGRTLSKRFSLIENNRNVLSRSKFLSVEKTPRSNSIETFFQGRTWSKGFCSIEPSRNIDSLSRVGQNQSSMGWDGGNKLFFGRVGQSINSKHQSKLQTKSRKHFGRPKLQHIVFELRKIAQCFFVGQSRANISVVQSRNIPILGRNGRNKHTWYGSHWSQHKSPTTTRDPKLPKERNKLLLVANMGNGTSYSATFATVPNPHDVHEFVQFKFISELYVVSHFTCMHFEFFQFIRSEITGSEWSKMLRLYPVL